MTMTERNLGKQVQEEIIAICRRALAEGAARREGAADSAQWLALRERMLAVVKEAFPADLFRRDRPLHARVVSRHEFEHFRVENVLFESLPGWEVNASVYLPKEPGHYPGVVCPTGHSAKTRPSYQTAAQTFARNGYAAVSFDPPGCTGEIQTCNDHFTNGLIGYLTGYWSQTHFVVDALRCMDYLETRDDIDSSAGFAMTGVSGGGLTTIFAAMLDERVKVSAPVCCLSEHEGIHLTDLYTSCPEQFGYGYIREGIDYADYLAIAAPTPTLVVAGKHDEVFDYRLVERLYAQTKRIFGLLGDEERCGLFIDEQSGHEYSVAMAGRVVEWMNRYLLGESREALPLTAADIVAIPEEQLHCHPSQETNMFTINRDAARQLEAERELPQAADERLARLRQAAASLLGVAPDAPAFYRATEQEAPPVRWVHELAEVDIEPEAGLHVPGLLLRRAASDKRRPALLFIDEAGKWNSLRRGGLVTRAGGFLQREEPANEPLALAIDASGFGRLEMEPTSYDLAWWNDIERIVTYLGIAAARPVMGLRVRDAIAGLRWLQQRDDVDPERLMVGGAGIGAIVALHAALLVPEVRRVVAVDGLSHYGAMTERFPFSWRQSVTIPHVLKHYDLPDIAGALSARVTVINPRDAAKELVPAETAERLYGGVAASGGRVCAGVSAEEAALAAVAAIRADWD
ncbi:alpha/beta hydrolase family protein [Paenibacillus cymbidii]|uniref:alpha/beta hydrolase family protein n=1 Tax=Paenibacillus cymbidii TaxID=1639034 RepID=UPI0010812F68|nr:acetylxylan esterase [Paenibacillus cymbidii]